MSRWRRWWAIGQRGWPASYPVAQFPNAPLAVAIVGMVGRRVADGDTAAAFDAVARAGLVVWAYLELTDGDNAFRRVLGGVGLVVLVVGLANDLSGVS